VPKGVFEELQYSFLRLDLSFADLTVHAGAFP
jgi:hypothetical protein